MIQEKGDLRDASPIRLLFRVHERGLTGILHLRLDDIQKTLYFHRGRFTWAISNAEGDRLDTVLVEGGRCSSQAVAALGPLPAGEQVGKALVEAGVVTLEELIAGTRDQLKRIVAGTLFWNRGTYQFSLDPPPDKLVSLDLEVPSLVWEILTTGVPMDPVWKAIGSLQIELVADADRIGSGMYTLPPTLTDTLARFSVPARLENAIAWLANQEKMPAIQGVYFLLEAGLLKRTEIPAQAPPPAMETPQRSADAVESEFAARYYSLEEREEPATEPPPPLREEPIKKTVRRLPLALMVIIALLLGGLLFLSLRQFLRHPRGENKVLPPPAKIHQPASPPSSSKPQEPSSKLADLPPETTNNPLPTVVSPPTKAPASATTSISPTTKTIVPEAKPEPAKPTPIPAEKPTVKPTPTTPPKPLAKPTSPPTEKPPVTLIPTVPPAGTADSPLALFLGGNYPAAAQGWTVALKMEGKRFAILLELICDSRWIREVYDLLPRKGEFFILAKKREDRTCYVIFCGASASEEEAQARLAELPKSLWSRRDPPEIVDLNRYL